jgi:hypothetical protein
MTPKIDKGTRLIDWANRAAIGAAARDAVLRKMDELDKVEIQLDKERWERTVDSRLDAMEKCMSVHIRDVDRHVKGYSGNDYEPLLVPPMRDYI